MRKGHPSAKRRPTIDQFCALEHVVASPQGGGFPGITDTMLEKMGKTRRVVLSVPHFLFVSALVTPSDMVAMQFRSRLIPNLSDETLRVRSTVGYLRVRDGNGLA